MNGLASGRGSCGVCGSAERLQPAAPHCGALGTPCPPAFPPSATLPLLPSATASNPDVARLLSYEGAEFSLHATPFSDDFECVPARVGRCMSTCQPAGLPAFVCNRCRCASAVECCLVHSCSPQQGAFMHAAWLGPCWCRPTYADAAAFMSLLTHLVAALLPRDKTMHFWASLEPAAGGCRWSWGPSRHCRAASTAAFSSRSKGKHCLLFSGRAPAVLQDSDHECQGKLGGGRAAEGRQSAGKALHRQYWAAATPPLHLPPRGAGAGASAAASSNAAPCQCCRCRRWSAWPERRLSAERARSLACEWRVPKMGTCKCMALARELWSLWRLLPRPAGLCPAGAARAAAIGPRCARCIPTLPAACRPLPPLQAGHWGGRPGPPSGARWRGVL